MAKRVAEAVGVVVLLAGGAALVWSLAIDPPYRSASELGPVQHVTDGKTVKAFEDKDTARLALAQFPLPVASDADAPDKQNLIKSVQIELARHGLDAGPVDGIASPATREAIAEYQRRMSLKVTGEPSRLLLEHLNLTQQLRKATASPDSDEMIRLIAQVQKKLGTLGYPVGKPSGVVTGETRDAIARFERDTGLPVTGEVTFKLVQRLNRFNYAPL